MLSLLQTFLRLTLRNPSKGFDTVSRNILIGRLQNCGTDKLTVRWIENWLIGRAQKAADNGAV